MAMGMIRALWIGTMLLVLAVTLFAFDGRQDNDIGIFFAWSMVSLRFPGGLLVPLLHLVLYDWLSVTVGSSYLSFAPGWLGLFVLGYVQWFILLPLLISKFSSSRT